MLKSQCNLCKRLSEIKWYLRDYHFFSGSFCRTCYNSVSHLPNGKPRFPKRYKKALERMHSE